MKFEINDKVKLIAPVSYLKTSDNMPMLRPPDLVAIDEVGEILSIKSPDTVEVKFRRGSFLLGNQSLDEILQRKIQLVSYGISPISENDLNSKIEEISSLDILKLTNKYLSKPFLSISGNNNICLEISNRWKKNF